MVQDRSFEDLVAGVQAQAGYRITPAIYASFVELFGDVNPLHVDDEYARRKSFKAKVMHGGILNGFLSHFVGTTLPGRRSLLLATDVRYAKPSYLGDEIQIEGRVSDTLQGTVEGGGIVVLEVVFRNLTQNYVCARARAQVQVAAA